MADTVVPGVFPGRLAGVMPLQDLALLVGGQLAALTGARADQLERGQVA